MCLIYVKNKYLETDAGQMFRYIVVAVVFLLQSGHLEYSSDD